MDTPDRHRGGRGRAGHIRARPVGQHLPSTAGPTGDGGPTGPGGTRAVDMPLREHVPYLC